MSLMTWGTEPQTVTEADVCRRFFELAPDLAAVFTPEGRMLRVNARWGEVLGYSETELLDTPGIEIVHPDDRAATLRALSLQQAGASSMRWINRCRGKDGGYRWFEWRAAPAAADGLIYSSGRDITESKAAADELEELNSLMADVEEISGVGAWRYDCATRRITWSRQIHRIIGVADDFDPSDIGQYTRFYAAEDQPALERAFRRAISEAVPYDLKLRLIRGNGEKIWVRTVGRPRLAQGKLVAVTGNLVNIDAQERAAEELRVARAAAERANLAKSRFLAAASHDLRQPLTALSLYVGVLKKQPSPDGGKLAASIRDCVDILSELLTDLLEVSKLDAGVVVAKPCNFAIADVLESLASVHASEAELKGLRLRVHYSRRIAHTDPRLLKRILGNLLANALRYTEQGGVLLACRRHQGRYWAEVWDTGVGIPADKTGVIFEEFVQLGEEGRAGGTGLGLAIVARTAALLGLEIRMRSRPGRGSMFAIELPPGQLISPDAMQGMLHAAGPEPGFVRIALVEDNALVMRALVLALEGAGHEVIEATSGESLFARLAEDLPDLLIADYRLAAAETGFDVIAAARERYGRQLPAILITGDTDPALMRVAAARGVAVYYKPLQIEALLAFVADAVEDRA